MAQHADAALIAAYTEWRSATAAIYSFTSEDETFYEALEARTEAPDKVLFQCVPTTVPGALAVLRRITPILANERWLDRALAYDDNETLKERKAELAYPHQQLVDCILALTRVLHDAASAEAQS